MLTKLRCCILSGGFVGGWVMFRACKGGISKPWWSFTIVNFVHGSSSLCYCFFFLIYFSCSLLIFLLAASIFLLGSFFFLSVFSYILVLVFFPFPLPIEDVFCLLVCPATFWSFSVYSVVLTFCCFDCCCWNHFFYIVVAELLDWFEI